MGIEPPPAKGSSTLGSEGEIESIEGGPGPRRSFSRRHHCQEASRTREHASAKVDAAGLTVPSARKISAQGAHLNAPSVVGAPPERSGKSRGVPRDHGGTGSANRFPCRARAPRSLSVY